MPLPTFSSSVSSDIASSIEEKLIQIEEKNGVRILFAIESGSRAWGFPSPDSDYDVRFVYAGDADYYLSLFQRRDVIELPIEGDLDINGWDIRKALRLSLKPNPVLLEWLSSPIKYRWNQEICAELLTLVDDTDFHGACLHHYFSIGRSAQERWISEGSLLKIKRYFYVLRPALAIRWIRLNPETVPPMNLQEMADGLALSGVELSALADLIQAKENTPESGEFTRRPDLDKLIDSEFEWASTSRRSTLWKDQSDAAEKIFKSIIAGISLEEAKT